ncbi:MAG: hypothetical protein ACRD0S_11570, partial [Acidimicrobiales bacterium]
YHSKAVAAHKTHSREQLRLPKWSTNGSGTNGSHGHVLSFEPPPAQVGEGPEAPVDDVPAHVSGEHGQGQSQDGDAGVAPEHAEEPPPPAPEGRRRRSRE